MTLIVGNVKEMKKSPVGVMGRNKSASPLFAGNTLLSTSSVIALRTVPWLTPNSLAGLFRWE